MLDLAIAVRLDAVSRSGAIVCVLGAPRSGTSLTTRLLSACGLFLGGSDDLIPTNRENVAGFWELRGAVRLNERLLRAVGGNSIAAPLLPPGWEEAPALEKLRTAGRALIDETFGDRPAWGWKDPRNSFTLPFWEALLGRPPRCVICVRNPLDVAASVRRMAGTRYAMDERQAIDLWGRYMASAIDNTSGRARLFVAYEEILGDPRTVAERMSRFAGLDPPATGDDALDGLVDRRLQHHRSPASTPRDARLPAAASDLYDALTHRLGADGAGAAEELDSMARRLLAADPAKVVGPTNLRPRAV